jgi:hypothetical protein
VLARLDAAACSPSMPWPSRWLRLDAVALPSRCSPSMPWPSSWTHASTRRRWPAVLAVEAVAVELDARLDAVALACGARRRCRGRRAGRPPRRGGVLAVEAVAVELASHLDAVALPSRCSPSMPRPSSWTRLDAAALPSRCSPSRPWPSSGATGSLFTLRKDLPFGSSHAVEPATWAAAMSPPSCASTWSPRGGQRRDVGRPEVAAVVRLDVEPRGRPARGRRRRAPRRRPWTSCPLTSCPPSPRRPA